MSFDVAADSYDRFMGRYSVRLGPMFADFAGVTAGQRVLDVGCGPGALTAELVRRLGPTNVSAVDPSESFVEAAAHRYPGVSVQRSSAEHLPFDDDAFDVTMAQLVVHFMTDPVAGLREMGRVTRAGGTVAACVWDHAGGKGPLSVFWDAALELDPDAHTESGFAGARAGHLAQLAGEAGLPDIEETTLSVSMQHQTFDEWWEPYTLGVGTVGNYMSGLDATQQAELRELCRSRLPEPPFAVTAEAWAVRAHA